MRAPRCGPFWLTSLGPEQGGEGQGMNVKHKKRPQDMWLSSHSHFQFPLRDPTCVCVYVYRCGFVMLNLTVEWQDP